MKTWLIFLFLLMALMSNGQEKSMDKHFSKVDSLYREDQFYLGVGINILNNTPSGLRQSGLSGGIHFGYIRDMPINKRRNLSIGLGLGFSFDTYSQNLFIGETESGASIFEVIGSDVEYSSNRFNTQIIEIPLQFRWRTSDIGDDSSFWRIYTGIHLGYMYYFRSRFEQAGNQVQQTQLDELERIRWSYYFSFGKSKINFFFKYNINALFNANLSNTDVNMPVDINIIKAGVIFYIL